LRETNELIAVWEGEKLTKEQAKEVTGIQTIFWTHQYETVFRNIVFEAENVYLNTNEHTRGDSPVQTREARFVIDFKEKYPDSLAAKTGPADAQAAGDQAAD
jgi:Xaa-Pro aminopeptidase